MKLTSYQRKAKKVVAKWLANGTQGEETQSVESPQAPLDELENALQCLKDVVCSVMELPLHWMESVTIRGFKVSYTKAGTRSVQVNYTKALRCGKVESYKTPLFQIDPPDESETEERACTTEEAVAVCAAIDAAEAYAQGDRKQSDCEAISHVFIDPNQTDLGLGDNTEG
jgi:hypothetical protein